MTDTDNMNIGNNNSAPGIQVSAQGPQVSPPPNPGLFQDVIDKLKQRENVKTKLQTHFNRELIDNAVLSNDAFSKYIDNPGIADPTTCYTVFWPAERSSTDRPSTLINDILKKSDIKFNNWRSIENSIGLSGELSIARLISYALEIMIALCQIPEFQKYIYTDFDSYISAKKTPDDKIKIIKIIKEFAKGKQHNFKNVFGKITQPTRLDFENDKPNEIVLDMLLILQQIKITYNKLPSSDGEEKNILSDAYTLLTKIILTKSSLDSCQAESIRYLSELDKGIEPDADADVKNNFCLFNSYDFSAVVNTPFCPVMGSAKYSGVKDEFIFIIDNSAILGLVLVLEYYDENAEDYNAIKSIKPTMTANNINSLVDFYEVINTPTSITNTDDGTTTTSIDNTIKTILGTEITSAELGSVELYKLFQT